MARMVFKCRPVAAETIVAFRSCSLFTISFKSSMAYHLCELFTNSVLTRLYYFVYSGNRHNDKHPMRRNRMSYLEKVQKAIPQAPVITIVGFPGVGKSTLAALFPSPIFIQAENASTVFETWPEKDQPAFFPEVQPANAKRKVKPSEIILDQLRELVTSEHPFKTVVIDTTTAMNTLFETEVVEFDDKGATNIGDAAGGFHKGFLVSAGMHAKIRQACEHLRRKGITVIFLAHTGIVKMKNRPESGEYTAYSIDMPEKARQIYVGSSDAVFYLKAREFVMGHEENKKGQTTKYGRVTNTGERVLITSSDGTIGYIDAKNRYSLPEEIDVEKGENPLLALIPFYNGGKAAPETNEEV